MVVGAGKEIYWPSGLRVNSFQVVVVCLRAREGGSANLAVYV